MRAIVTDTETTGTEHGVDEIVEIAAVTRIAGELYTSSSLCDPGRDIPPEAMAVHHITPSMLVGAPSPAAAIADVVGGLQEGVSWVMVAHNAAFDRGFLARHDETLADPALWICTWRCAMHLWPGAPGHGNQVLRYWLGVGPELPADLYPHRALYDTIVTQAILDRMLETHSLEELVRLSTAPVVLQKARFGKYRGRDWSWIVRADRGWCDWYLRQEETDPDVVHTILHHRAPAQGRLV